jgi:hypothetical protein
MVVSENRETARNRPTITEYIVETPDPDGKFETFLEISEGNTAQVDQSNYEFLLSLFRELQNWDQFWSVRVTLEGEPIISGDEPIPPELLIPECEKGIKALESNFFNVTHEKFKQIPNMSHLSASFDSSPFRVM